ncbi:hypothetical protein MAGR_17200 [Mycolicibacterium agri]|uniref:DUF302 domain-containing protein n=1 Tax=Mycolicibacterium agri TaxID=36811 RepID=A0A7I9VYJ9_MYCAG|nr:hypothetical protein MAGR_17200 [Mycolicibacterium agri]
MADAITEIPFNGLRLRFDSAKSFEALVDALLADIGRQPAPLYDLVAESDNWDGFERAVQRYVGPSGFMLFAAVDHGGWIVKAGIHRRVVRVVLGNPLIAITMLRHDITAGLFAPVEVLLTEEAGNRSALTYVAPSSLIVVEPNEPLEAAARELDAKLKALALSVTGSADQLSTRSAS